MPNEIAPPGRRIITANLPSKETLDAKAAGVLATVEALEIDSHAMMEVAADELRSLKADYKKLEEARQLHVGSLNDEVKFINNFFRGAITTMEQAEGSLKRKMLTYQNEQEERRRAEQARIEVAQRAERARMAAENAAREREAQEQASKQSASDAAATLLAAAQQNAASETVALVMTAPVHIAPKLAGISTKGTYKGKVTDLLALIRFIAKNPQYVNLVKGNDTAVNAIAKAQRDACQIEGILVYEDKTLAARSA